MRQRRFIAIKNELQLERFYYELQKDAIWIFGISKILLGSLRETLNLTVFFGNKGNKLRL